MHIKLILLDFDGTLASTEDANMGAYLLALREEGIELDTEEYRRRYFGMRCPEFLRELGITDENDIDRIRRRKIELYPTLFDSVHLNEPLWNFAQDSAHKVARCGLFRPDRKRISRMYYAISTLWIRWTAS